MCVVLFVSCSEIQKKKEIPVFQVYGELVPNDYAKDKDSLIT